MKTIGLLCLLLPMVVIGAPKPIQITFDAGSYQIHSIELRIAGEVRQVKVDEKGKGVAQFNLPAPYYATMGNIKLFLEPGKNLLIRIDETDKDNKVVKVQFSGAGAP